MRRRCPAPTAGGWLTCENLHDLAWVFVDGKLLGSLDISCPRAQARAAEAEKPPALAPLPGGTKIGVLVEAMGRVNYGPGPMDRKGITGLRLGGQYLMDFTVTTLPLDDLSGLDFTRPAGGYPRVYRGTFTVDSQDECFVDLCNFTKGMVYVNGFNWPVLEQGAAADAVPARRPASPGKNPMRSPFWSYPAAPSRRFA